MAEDFKETLLKLQGELDLDPSKFKTKHSKAVNDALIEAQHLVNTYKTLQQEFSKIPTPQALIKARPGIPSFEKGKYAGRVLTDPSGTPYTSYQHTEQIEAAKQIRKSLIQEKALAKAQAVSAVSALPGIASKEQFLTAKAELDRLFSVKTEQGGFGRNIESINKATITLGKNLGLSRAEVEKFLKTGMSFNDRMAHMGSNMERIARRALETVPVWMAIRSGIQFVQKAIGETLKFWADFETAMTQIRIVGMGVDEEYNQLGNNILAFSVKYGTATKEVAEAAKLFAQQGLSIKEVTEATRAATLGALVLEKSVGSVAEDLTAATKAYNIPMEDSVLIIDKWMKVQKDFAISAKELADGMRTAGATAAAFGITFDQFAGHLTAVVEVTRKTGSQAANALQMIYTRLFSTASEAIQTIAKVPIYQTQAGKAVEETTGIFRNAGDVIDDIALKWNGLNDAQKINLATQIGSRRQAAPFIALMINYNRALAAQVASLTAAGESMKAYNLISDTINFKIQQMNNTWLTLANSMQQTSIWKKSIDFVKGLGDALLYLVNAQDAYLKIINETKSKEIDQLTIKKNQLEALKELYELERKQQNSSNVNRQNIIKKAIINLEEIFPQIKEEDIDKMVDEIDIDLMMDRVSLALEKEFSLLHLASYKDKFLKGGLVNLIWPELEESDKAAIVKKFKIDEDDVIKEVLKASKEVEKRGGFEKLKEEYKRKYQELLAGEEVNLALSKDQDLMREAEKRALIDDDTLDTKEQLEVKLNHELEMLRIKGFTEKEILTYQIQQREAQDQLRLGTKNQLELDKLRLQYQKETTKEIYEQANAIQTSLASSIKNIMSGTAGLGSIFTDLNTTMAESYRTVVSDELAKGLMSTGIGVVFGESMISLQGGIKKAHESVYEWIKRGHKDGISEASGGATSPTAGYTGVGGFSRIEGAFGGGLSAVTSNLLPGFSGGASNLYGVRGGRVGPASRQQIRNQNIGMGVQSALTGYSAYQSAKQGGISQGQSIGAGVLGAAGSLTAGFGMAALGTAAAFGPVGWIAAGAMILASVLMGSMGGKKSTQSSVETRTSENKISSKIDVSNRNLEIINRNLIGMRQDIKTYILPSSAYFSTKDSLEAEFSLSSKRGII